VTGVQRQGQGSAKESPPMLGPHLNEMILAFDLKRNQRWD
jgi:hypothetical protein